MKENQSEKIQSIFQAVSRYDGLLEQNGLRDGQVASQYPFWSIPLYIYRQARGLFLLLPLAMIGTVLNWLPYGVTAWAAARLTPHAEEKATYKLYGAFFLFPLWWLFLALISYFFVGLWKGLEIMVLAPLSGFIAMLFHEQRGRFIEQARAYLRLRTHSRIKQELQSMRQNLYNEISDLVALYQNTAAGQDNSPAETEAK